MESLYSGKLQSKDKTLDMYPNVRPFSDKLCFELSNPSVQRWASSMLGSGSLEIVKIDGFRRDSLVCGDAQPFRVAANQVLVPHHLLSPWESLAVTLITLLYYTVSRLIWLK